MACYYSMYETGLYLMNMNKLVKVGRLLQGRLFGVGFEQSRQSVGRCVDLLPV